MTWAWTVRLQPTGKIVLLALADEANDAGFCFPSHEHLARKCELGERTVRRMIKLLAARNYLSIERRFNKNRSCTSNGYRLAIGPLVKLTGHPVTGDQVRGFPVTRGGVTGDQVTTTEPCLYPKLPPPVPSGEGEIQERCGGELCYPKAMTKVQMQALRNHLAGLTDQDAQQVLDELAGRMNSTQVRNPIRYCVALVSRLKRGEFTAELGLQIAERRRAENQRQARLREVPGGVVHAADVMISRLPECISAPLERIRARANAQLSAAGLSSAESTGPQAQDATN